MARDTSVAAFALSVYQIVNQDGGSGSSSSPISPSQVYRDPRNAHFIVHGRRKRTPGELRALTGQAK